MRAESYGTTRERQIREIASRLGVADFVYTAPPILKGAAPREASGDGLIVVGNKGAVLQVKARNVARAPADSDARAKSWITKSAIKAARQGAGSRREITRRWRDGTPLVVHPVRAAHLPPDHRAKYTRTLACDASSWPVIVVIDHPRPQPLQLDLGTGVVWMTAADWTHLHRRLRSASALIAYVERILADRVDVPLGHEAARYSALRAADEATSKAGGRTTRPYLPHIDEFDQTAADCFQGVLNKVWPDDGPTPWRHADDYRSIVELMDSIPPVFQAEVGRFIMRKRQEVSNGTGRTGGIVSLNKTDRLMYARAKAEDWEPREHWLAHVFAMTMLRHTQSIESGAPDESMTLGVGELAEAREETPGASLVFVLLRGRDAQIELPVPLRRSLEAGYGIYDHLKGTVRSR